MSINQVCLNQTQTTEIITFYRKISTASNVHEYGKSNDPCLRVKHPNDTFQHTINENEVVRLYTYSVGYIYAHRVYPHKYNDDVQISHYCGNPVNRKRSLCIQGTHMTLESRTDNIARKKCHNYIRKFANRYKKIKSNSFTKGKINVQDINDMLNESEKYHECHCSTKHCFISYGKL